MKTEFDENVLEYWKITNGNYIVRMKKDDGLDDYCDIKILYLRFYVLLS